MKQDPLSQAFAALADPTRRAIVARLREGEALIKDLAEPFDITLPAVIKHVNVLEEAGLVSRRREAQRKPIRLEPEPLIQLDRWLENYRVFWEARYKKLDEVLEETTDDLTKRPT